MAITMNKFKVDLDESQRSAVIRILGCCRFIHNHFLVLNQELSKYGMKTLSCGEMHSILKDMVHNDEYAWLQEAEQSSLDEVLKDLSNHLNNHLGGKGEYPELASKRASCQSYRIRNENNDLIVNECTITLPKLGSVALKQPLHAEGKILYATIFRTSSDHYFICIAIDTKDTPT